jgi:paraquat-inducible protein A
MSTPFNFTCPVCSQAHGAPVVREAVTLSCRRCSHVLVMARAGSRFALPWTLAAGVLLATLAWLPLVKVEKLGMGNSIRIHEIGAALRGQGMDVLGWFVDFCLLAAPATLLGATLLLSAATLTGVAFPGWRRVLHVVEWARRWTMIDVLILAILVSFLKIGAIARASFEPGFAALAGGVVALIIGQQAFDSNEVRAVLTRPGETPDEQARGPASLQPACALLFAAAIALVPANLLPIMEISIGAKTSQSTIFGGIAMLANEGMWGIALVIFFASFLVPLGKIAGLFWLLVRSRQPRGRSQEVRLHGWLDFIGRWSMLDVLLVGVLAALVEFGVLANVKAGPGAPAFAAAVVLTVLAVESFPLRRLFHSATSVST